MAELEEKISAVEKVAKSPLLILAFVLLAFAYLFYIEREDAKSERLRQENRMDKVVDKTVEALDNNTRALYDQKEVITELKIMIENKE